MPKDGLEPIPHPPAIPFFGNVLALEDRNAPIRGLVTLGKKYGPLYRFDIPGSSFLVASSHALIAEMCRNKRFKKALHPPFVKLRPATADGLFTATNEEPNWAKAHRILSPVFSPSAMHSYFSDMLDIVEQMISKWRRLGPEENIAVTDNMTRVSLDTIALCGMGFRFNSFYREAQHPFVNAMDRVLIEVLRRCVRPSAVTNSMIPTRRKFSADIKLMMDITEQLIADHRKQPPRERSQRTTTHMLGRMLEQADPQTGELLAFDNVQRQCLTFLIAGHETTSGMMSFALYLLLNHPNVMTRARQLVDRTIGGGRPRFEHMAQLGYIEQILKETLRLYPTVGVFALSSPKDEVLGEKFMVPADTVVYALVDGVHRDTSAWPEPSKFDPDRFSPEAQDSLPKYSWIPFGNGARSCIGRNFALQEGVLVLAMILQHFDIAHARPYQLETRENLSVKPYNLVVRVRARTKEPGDTPAPSTRNAPDAPISPPPKARIRILNGSAARAPGGPRHDTPLTVAFGGNSGTCEGLARRVAGDGEARGYRCRVVSLDEAARRADHGAPLVVVCASYYGEPPDNARAFAAWCAGLGTASLDATPVAVFGCGDRNWAATYQAVPRRLAAALEQAGARPVLPRGEGNAGGDLFADFEAWYAGLWDALAERLGITTAVADGTLYVVEETPRGTPGVPFLPAGVPAAVRENVELVDLSWPFARSKRHIALELPLGLRYRPGDYLAIWPQNAPEQVARAAARFGIGLEETVVLRSRRGAEAAGLPLGTPLRVSELLAARVELASPVTAQEVAKLADACPDAPQREHLAFLAADPVAFRAEIGALRMSALDVLEAYPAVALSFAAFLALIPAMRARQYSVSSSPLAAPGRCTLTVAVVEGRAPQGIGRFRGAASTYLARLRPGDSLAVTVKEPNLPFRPPADNRRPLILIGAGTGVAPLRAFIEDRTLRHAAGEPAGPMVLYFGCDHPHIDYLYRDQFQALADRGELTLRPTFARQPENGHRFVQERMWHERDQVAALMAQDALVLVCGNAKTLAPAAVAVLGRIYADAHGLDAAAGEAHATEMQAKHAWVLDVFG